MGEGEREWVGGEGVGEGWGWFRGEVGEEGVGSGYDTITCGHMGI